MDKHRLEVMKSSITGVNRHTGNTTMVVDKAIEYLHKCGTIILLEDKSSLSIYEDALTANNGVLYNSYLKVGVVANMPIDLNTLNIDNGTIVKRIKKRLDSEYAGSYKVLEATTNHLGRIIVFETERLEYTVREKQ